MKEKIIFDNQKIKKELNKHPAITKTLELIIDETKNWKRNNLVLLIFNIILFLLVLINLIITIVL